MNSKVYFDSRIKAAFGAGAGRIRGYSEEVTPVHLLYTLKQVCGLTAYILRMSLVEHS